MVHALHRQICVQRLNGTVLQTIAQRNDDRCELRGVPLLGKVDDVGAELDDLAASIGILGQIVQIANTIYLADSEMTTILLYHGVEDGHGLIVVGVVGGKVFVNDRHRSQGETSVCSDLRVMDGDKPLQIPADAHTRIFRRRLGTVVEVRQLTLTVEDTIAVKILAFRQHTSGPDLLAVFLDRNIRDHSDNRGIASVMGWKRHHQGAGPVVLQSQFGIDDFHAVNRKDITVNTSAVCVNRIHRCHNLPTLKSTETIAVPVSHQK